jgi:antitoxin component YwqK of YwqJK toxin-antitoxin module
VYTIVQAGKYSLKAFMQINLKNGLTKVYRRYGVLQYEENFKNGRTDGFKKYCDYSGN